MISFTDKRLYVKGTCQAIASDVSTGDIIYFSNKFTTGNVTTSVTMGEIRAGLGNPVAAIIPSDSALNVEFTAADFSLWAKSAQVGATLSYNAPAMACQVVSTTGSALTIDVTKGTPVAQYGYSKVVCYVQEVGSAAPIATTGTAYPLDAEGGAISEFTAESGKQYKVWYFVNKASARVAKLSTLFDPKVVHFTAQIAVYSNESGESTEGTRVGWLYVIVPRLKLGGNAGITGDQSNNDTTSMSGQAIAFDTDTISATCSDNDSSALAYYVYVPDVQGEDITGLAIVGGVLSVPVSTSMQTPVKFVMGNGELVVPNYNELTYSISGLTGTTVSTSGVISAGTTAGDGEITAKYANGDTEYSVVANLSVVSA